MAADPTDPGPDVPFVEFMRELGLDGLDLAREPDFGREVDLNGAD